MWEKMEKKKPEHNNGSLKTTVKNQHTAHFSFLYCSSKTMK